MKNPTAKIDIKVQDPQKPAMSGSIAKTFSKHLDRHFLNYSRKIHANFHFLVAPNSYCSGFSAEDDNSDVVHYLLIHFLT